MGRTGDCLGNAKYLNISRANLPMCQVNSEDNHTLPVTTVAWSHHRGLNMLLNVYSCWVIWEDSNSRRSVRFSAIRQAIDVNKKK